MYTRFVASSVQAALLDTPVVLIIGPRQAGKSTMAQQVALSRTDTGEQTRYITLDDLDVLAAAKQDPVEFIASLDGPVVIDEIQRAPELFLSIKASVDRNRQPGRFLLTGSADVLLLPKVADSLAGRMEVIHLWPLSQGEILGWQTHFIDNVFAPQFSLSRSLAPSLPHSPAVDLKDSKIAVRQELVNTVIRGGYPEAVKRDSPSRRRAFFRSYVNTLLTRDVRDLSGVSDVSRLAQLLTALAGRVGSLAKGEDLSRTLAIPATTLRRYLDLLEVMFIVTPLPAWSVNIGSRVIKSPKLYMVDTGLLANQISATESRITKEPSVFGPLLENFVVSELQKQITWSDVAPSMFHFRATAGQEVDIVLEAPDGRVVAIEVKATATPTARDFSGLKYMAERLGDKMVRGIVLYGGKESLPFGPNLFAIPVRALWNDSESPHQPTTI